MKEIHPEPGSQAEEALKRFRPNANPEQAAKRKRFTGGIFIVNIVLITVLYLFYASQNKTETYQTATINYKDLQFRFSLVRDRATGNVNISLTTRPAPGRGTVANFKDGIADVIILHGTTAIMQKPLGREIATLTLKPDEINVQSGSIDRHEIGIITDAHPEYLVTPGRSFIQFEKPYIPLTAEARIHVDPPVSTSITFKYEVDR